MKFDIFDHTGDIGIRFYGHTYEDLIKEGFSAVSGLMGSQPGRRRVFTTTEEIKHGTPEILFYDLISKLIYHFEVDMVHITSVMFPDGIGKQSTLVKMMGYRINTRFRYGQVFKSPTFHLLELNPTKGYGTIVLDI